MKLIFYDINNVTLLLYVNQISVLMPHRRRFATIVSIISTVIETT